MNDLYINNILKLCVWCSKSNARLEWIPLAENVMWPNSFVDVVNLMLGGSEFHWLRMSCDQIVLCDLVNLMLGGSEFHLSVV